MPYPKIFLQKGKEHSLRRKHHWVFSGAIARHEEGILPGNLVSVYSSRNEFLGIGHFAQGSIMVRILSFEEREIDVEFWKEKLGQAYAVRKALQLTDQEDTTIYRLVHGEGDGLPGLIIDYYQGTAVIQAHTLGMHAQVPQITEALKLLYKSSLEGVFDKSAETLPKSGEQVENTWIWGKAKSAVVKEYGASYAIDWKKDRKQAFLLIKGKIENW